jgi:hypothetical protein
LIIKKDSEEKDGEHRIYFRKGKPILYLQGEREIKTGKARQEIIAEEGKKAAAWKRVFTAISE